MLREKLETFKNEGKAVRCSSLNGSLEYDDDYDAQSKLTIYLVLHY